MSITACNYHDQVVCSDVKANKVIISEAAHARTTLLVPQARPAYPCPRPCR